MRTGSCLRAWYLVPCTLALLSATGCRTVVDTVAGAFGPGGVGPVVDAHVVYRLRPDCPALLARTVDHGYTVLTPTGALTEGALDAVPTLPDAFAGVTFEETGVFEGPVRTGEVVFRYVPPAESETWTAGFVDVVAQVDAVGLDLPAGHDRMIALCGPLDEGEASAPVPRLPGQR